MKSRMLIATATAGAVALAGGLLAVPAAVAADPPSAADPLRAAVVTTDPTEFVDPFMGTQHDHGQMIPGAFAPSGIVKSTPVTYPKRAHGGYDYAQSQITGFVHTNTDGAGGNPPGGSTAGRVATTLTASAPTSRYRKAHRVTVAVTSKMATPPTGTVTLTRGSKTLGTARLIRGKAVVTLPRSLKVGTYELVVAYLPQTTEWAASKRRVKLRIGKARAAIRVTGSKTLRVGKRARIVVRVKGVGPYSPKGAKVRLTARGRVIGKAKVVKKKKRWVAVIRTKKLTKSGKVTLKFYGKSSLATQKIKTKLRVKRAGR